MYNKIFLPAQRITKKIKPDAGNFGYILATGKYPSETRILASDLALSNPEISEANGFLFYPNPCRDQIFYSGLDSETLKEITIYNLTGQLVFAFMDIQQENSDVSFL